MVILKKVTVKMEVYSVIFAIWIFAIIAIFIILVFSVALRVKLVFDSYKEDMNMTLLWLNPLLRAQITMEDNSPVMTIYVLNKKAYSRKLKNKSHKTGGMELLKLTNPKDIHVNTSFGFRDPFITGIACGAINVASQFINIESINQNPDFTAENDYIYMDATAKVNSGFTLINLLRAQKH